MGNLNSAKEHLYSAIESSKLDKIAEIMKEFPQLLNNPITDDCKSTALGRASWRGDIPLIELLLGMGANINYAGPREITPLMWACKSNKPDVICYLLQNGAHSDVLGPLENGQRLYAIEYCILHGNYECALIFIEQYPEQENFIKNAKVYAEIAGPRQYRYINYEIFIKHLVQKCPTEMVPDFFKKPEKPKLRDPVIDPRESWKDWFKRVAEFGTPPLVERDELPEHLQPHKRIFGLYHSYLHGLNPYPKKDNASQPIQKKENQLFQLSENILNQEANYQFVDSKSERIPSNTLKNIGRQKTYEDKNQDVEPNQDD